MLAILLTMLAVQQPAPRLDIVEVVGCLTEAPGAAWVVTRGSEPVVSKVPFTSAAAVAQAVARPLGVREYRLIGAGVFSPAEYKGRKVVVKGVLIRDAKEDRINVTSLQSASEMCASQ
jgi:hypothetical protein